MVDFLSSRESQVVSADSNLEAASWLFVTGKLPVLRGD